jgi:2-hydroxy-6-oxonona-2,4-dienedioate hydrolase
LRLEEGGHTYVQTAKNNMKNIVVLSGFSREKDSYWKLIQSAPKGWNVVIPSYRELGLPRGINFFEKNLFSLIKKLGSSEIYLLGHSLGGALAIGFLYKYKSRVKNLFLIDSKGVSKASFIEDAVQLFVHGKKTLSARIRNVIRITSRPFFHIQSGLIAHNASLERELTTIKAETILFWGEDDGLTPLEDGRKMQKLIPNSRLIVLEKLGHDWILDHPHKFWEKVN